MKMIFNSNVLPEDVYHIAGVGVKYRGHDVVCALINEDARLLEIAPDIFIGWEHAYRLKVFEQNKDRTRYIPCMTGSNDPDDVSYIRYINTVALHLTRRYLELSEDERKTCGYKLSHWVGYLDSKGRFVSLAPKTSGRAMCEITGYQSPIWVLGQASNGATQPNGGRIKLAHPGFLPISADEVTMIPYHRASKTLLDGTGKVRSTCNTAMGIEIEGQFLEGIGEHDLTDVNGAIFDKVVYKNVVLNRRGVMASLILKLRNVFKPYITRDATVNFELLSQPRFSLQGTRDEMCICNKILDTRAKYGTHVQISVVDEMANNIWEDLDVADTMYPIAQKLFQPFLDSIAGQYDDVVKVFGRYFDECWAQGFVGYENHNSAVNMTERHTIEFRLVKYQNEAQFMRVVNMACDMALVFDKVLHGGDMIAAQAEIMKLWKEAVNEKGRADRNTKKTPNDEGTRNRNLDE